VCGIFGYIGSASSYEVVRAGLERLAYRGYDSAGIASVVLGEYLVEKCVGHPEGLSEACCSATLSIGHNRWATHGKPSIENSHPHFSNDGKIALVHNGIVENYSEIKLFLTNNGFDFYSDTDSELIPNLIQFYMSDLSVEAALVSAMRMVRGAYAIVFSHLDYAGTLFAASLGSPVCIAKDARGGVYVSSDFSSLPDNVCKAMTLTDNKFAKISDSDNILVSSLGGKSIAVDFELISKVTPSYDTEGYSCFLEKEIFEQPYYIRNALSGRAYDDEIKLGGIMQDLQKIKDAEEVIFTGCGSAFFAAQLGAYAMETISKKRARAIPAGELKYYGAIINDKTVLVSISQSGETADTIGCIKSFKRHGALAIGIVNVPNSTIAKLVDSGIYIRAGKEVSVASTKSVMNQVVAMLLMIYLIAAETSLSELEYTELLSELKDLPGHIESLLLKKESFDVLAKEYHTYDNMLVIGRGALEIIAKETALKIKEISYIHAEGYSAAELKHGPLALISKDMPTAAFVPSGVLEEKMISNIMEIKSREGPVIGFVSEKCSDELKNILNNFIEVPASSSKMTESLVFLVAGQLFAYYLAKERKCDIDRPRNLAKSVSVE
jgi:glucosamine--fructose-6-phosphate aminotransferase (isomerizing)